MQVEAIEMNGHYFIPALDNQGLKKKRIRFDIPDEKLKDDSEEVYREEIEYSDEYIEKHWREILSKGLGKLNHNYYKSDQYMYDRGEYLAEKYK